jgi:3-oxoacyl-[acyl-carrier protein] reductase
MELQGRTALVTGSCGYGTGASTALRLAREGANIVLNYGTCRRGREMAERGQRIAREIEKLGSRAIVQEADTRDEHQVKRMVEAGKNEFGGVDILVNNAGGLWHSSDCTKVDIEEWRSTLAAEIDGALLTMKHVLPGMRKRRWGRIIHMGLEGVFRHPGAPGPAYCLGKAARSWMAEAFAPTDFKRGITMNCIELGWTNGLDLEDAVRLAKGKHLDVEITTYSPVDREKKWQGRWRDRQSPVCHDIGEIVAFLCSDCGRFISGNQIRLPQW